MKTPRLDWRPSYSYWHAAEVALLSLVALGLAYWAVPKSPLNLDANFPWIWLAPVLIALRYGMLNGLMSAAILLTGWMIVSNGGSLPREMPMGTLLGGLILTMLCGEFSGLWRNRHRRQSELNHYLDQRLEELTRQHYLLKLSHDRLEQNLISRPFTLRGALAELRVLLRQADSTESLPGATDLMGLLAAHCQLTTAAMYPARNNRIAESPVATFGEPGALRLDDPLVQYALEKRTLVHVNQDSDIDETPSQYLVAAPIYREGTLTGLLTVTHMPFFMFHHDTLRTLAALLSYYADTFTSGQAQETLHHFPDCPPDFAENLERLAHVQRDSGVASHLAVLSFPQDARGLEIRLKALQGKRELDFFWLHEGPAPLLIALFPLTGEEGIQGYLARFNVWLEAEYSSDCRGLGIQFSSQPLDPVGRVAQLQSMINHAS